MITYRNEFYGRYESTFKGPSSEGIRADYDRIYPFRAWLPENREARIVDVGCGTGTLLLALKEAGYSNICGVDVGPEQVAAAKSKQLSVELAEAEDFLLRSTGEYQMVIACDVLEHLTRDEAIAFLRAAKHAISPGGTILLRLPNAAAPRGNVYQFGDLTHETPFSPSSIRQLCGIVGTGSVAFREDVPPSDTLLRAARRTLWCGLRLAYKVADIIETGVARDVYSRNMLVRIAF